MVGEWDDFNGEYGPERDYRIRSNLNIQGAILKLLGNDAETREIYIERIPGAWEINISMDLDNVHMQVLLQDDGQLVAE